MGTNVSQTPVRPLPTIDPLRNRLKPHTIWVTQSITPSPLPSSSHDERIHPLKWPLPPPEREEVFEPHWTVDDQRYSVRQVYRTKAKEFHFDSTVQDVHTSTDFHQKESQTTELVTLDSAAYESALVKSSLSSQCHSCINLSTTEEIDRLLRQLDRIYQQLDTYLQKEYASISKQGQDIVNLIVEDTRRVQQELLTYGKGRQKRQDELYNEYLQKYVVVLNEWKSKELAKLQKQMEDHQKDIVALSQSLIIGVNGETNDLRDEVSKNSERIVSRESQKIIDEIQSKSHHHLGTETKTRIRLTIDGTVGDQVPGTRCVFDFNQVDVNGQDNEKKPGISRNTTRK